jgi:hypothetical protein
MKAVCSAFPEKVREARASQGRRRNRKPLARGQSGKLIISLDDVDRVPLHVVDVLAA